MEGSCAQLETTSSCTFMCTHCRTFVDMPVDILNKVHHEYSEFIPQIDHNVLVARRLSRPLQLDVVIF